MLCVKCGREHEGNSCPWCEAPQILINSDDYLKRRQAYEEKQAGLRSASSDSTEHMSEGLENIKNAVNKVSKTVKRMRGRIIIKPALAIRCLAVLVCLAAVVSGIVLLLNRTSYTLYLRIGEGVYEMTGGEMKHIGEDADIYMTADGKHMYKGSAPSGYEQNVSSRQVSLNGRYYAAVSYTDGAYHLNVWNKEASHHIVDSKSQIEIIYVTDDGKVIYTSTHMVNDEGAVGAYELYVYAPSDAKDIAAGGVLRAVEEELRRVYVVAWQHSIVYVDDENSLNIYNYKTDSYYLSIAESINGVYMSDNNSVNLYAGSKGYVSISDRCEGFVYVKDGKYYYVSLKSYTDEHSYIGRSASESVSLVFNKDYVYLISSDSVSCVTISKETNQLGESYINVSEPSALCALNSADDVLWLNDSSILVCVDAEGRLVHISKGKKVVVTENVDNDTLRRVDGTTCGYAYCSADKLYYVSKAGRAACAVNISDVIVPDEVIVYKGKLYLQKDGMIYICNDKLNSTEKMLEADYMWIVR